MSTYYRRDEWVTDAMGNAISGASVYVCSQPATTTSIPPSPLQQVYADSAGATPITQPVITDGYGHASYYVAPGTYTVVYYSPQIQQLNLPDQSVAPGGVSVPVAVNQGGTGATTAPAALTNLGAAASGANVDITSLGNIPNTVINTSGYQYAGVFGTVNSVTIANESFTGTGYSGIGVGVSSPTASTVLGAGFIGTSGTVTAQFLNALTQANLGTLRVGTTGVGLIQSYVTGQPLQIGALGNPTGPTLIISSGQVTPTNGQGLLKFDSNYYTQTTVGPAGSASALPSNPRGYIQFTAPDGTNCVIPFYKSS